MGGQHLNKPVVGIAGTPTGSGYTEVATDGGVFNFGTRSSPARWVASISTSHGRHRRSPGANGG